MSEKQRLQKTGKLHFPLHFSLPASFTELGAMMDELQAAMLSCPGDWLLCFHGINLDYGEGYMRIHFSLFPHNTPKVGDKIPTIEMHISDKGMNVIYPVEYYDQVIVDMMMDTFVSHVNKLQETIKAARHA